MRTYKVTITMADGSQGHHQGVYEDGFDAILCAMDVFPEAHRISVEVLP